MIKIVSSTDFKPEEIIRDVRDTAELTGSVAGIISNVQQRGDEALREYTERFDNCKLDNFELEPQAIDRAVNSVDKEFMQVLQRSAASIEEYHLNQVSTGFDLLPKNGIILGQKVTPIERVGCYIPGGTAPYPSSVLMNCIPAKIAGVKQIIVTTPPCSGTKKGDDCNGVNAHILAAAKISGVDRIFTLGGAQAIAALAYGTKTVPRVDKITGPGNAYVTEAKRQVFGIAGIDMLAGPSDILVIADKYTPPELAAADMLSQCEHGGDSRCILVTDSAGLAKKVQSQIRAQLKTLPRSEQATKAIKENSIIIVAPTMEEVFEISNSIAPEHLEILLDEPFNYLSRVVNAGSIFLGYHTPETLGDYLAGPNHVLPTGATARFSGPLTVDDFIKKSSYAYFTREAMLEKGPDAIRFAEEEQLIGHALAVKKRIDMETKD